MRQRGAGFASVELTAAATDDRARKAETQFTYYKLKAPCSMTDMVCVVVCTSLDSRHGCGLGCGVIDMFDL